MLLSHAEPELEGEALRELDALADHIEISRLVGLGVLISPENVADGAKRLSTKIVRTRRCKTRHDVKAWRREFTWMWPRKARSVFTSLIKYYS